MPDLPPPPPPRKVLHHFDWLKPVRSLRALLERLGESPEQEAARTGKAVHMRGFSVNPPPTAKRPPPPPSSRHVGDTQRLLLGGYQPRPDHVYQLEPGEEKDIRVLSISGSQLKDMADLLGLSMVDNDERARPEDDDYITIEIAGGDTIPVHDDDGVVYRRAIAFDPEAGREEGVMILA